MGRSKMACWLSGQPVKAKPDNQHAILDPLVFGVASLPLGSPVELEVILEVKS